MREAGVLLDRGGEAFFWHTPNDRSVTALPDSQDLWDVIWKNRDDLSGFAHSHPSGVISPSHTDVTTFAAIELALGRRLDWWIWANGILVHTYWAGHDRLSYKSSPVVMRPSWVASLHERSCY